MTKGARFFYSKKKIMHLLMINKIIDITQFHISSLSEKYIDKLKTIILPWLATQTRIVAVKNAEIFMMPGDS